MLISFFPSILRALDLINVYVFRTSNFSLFLFQSTFQLEGKIYTVNKKEMNNS